MKGLIATLILIALMFCAVDAMAENATISLSGDGCDTSCQLDRLSNRVRVLESLLRFEQGCATNFSQRYFCTAETPPSITIGDKKYTLKTIEKHHEIEEEIIKKEKK